MSIKGFNIDGNIERIDYNSLENIPFGSEYKKATDILEVKEYEFIDNDGTTSLMLEMTSLPPVIAGASYNFVLGGINEQITFTFDEDEVAYMAGNMDVVSGNYNGTGKNYFIGIVGNPEERLYQIMIFTTEQPGTYVAGLSYVSDSVPLILDGEYAFEEVAENIYGYMTAVFGLSPREIDKLKLVLDGEFYEITKLSYYENIGGYYAGNPVLIGWYDDPDDDTGENYAIAMMGQMLVVASTAGSHTVSLEMTIPMTETIHKIDSKYLNVPYEIQEDTILFSKSIEIPEGLDIRFGQSGNASLSELNKTSSLIKEGNCNSPYDSSTIIGGGNGADAIGSGSLSLGTGTYASGQYSQASGYNSTAIGYCSTAEGETTCALGINSHAEGKQDYTYSDYITGVATDNSTIRILNSDKSKIIFLTATNNKIFYITTSQGRYGQYAREKSSTSDETYTYYALEKSLYNIWDNTEVYLYKPSGAIGDYSHVEGLNTQAMGSHSHSEGWGTIVRGTASHAEGYDTLVAGSYSHAEGNSTISKRDCSHAEGKETLAMGTGAHVEGYFTTASGEWSHAEGTGNETPELQGTAIRYAHDSLYIANVNYADLLKYTKSRIAFGAMDGSNSSDMKEPIYITCIDSISPMDNGARISLLEQINDIDEGIEVIYKIYNTGIAKGDYSHSEGKYTIAGGNNSHAEGIGTIAQGESQHVEGRYNEIDGVASLNYSSYGKYAHIVGNGTSDGSRSNAHTLDWDGNAWYAGKVTTKDVVVKDNNGAVIINSLLATIKELQSRIKSLELLRTYSERIYAHFEVDRAEYPYMLISVKGTLAYLHIFIKREADSSGNYYFVAPCYEMQITVDDGADISTIVEAYESNNISNLIFSTTKLGSPEIDGYTYYANFDYAELGYSGIGTWKILE